MDTGEEYLTKHVMFKAEMVKFSSPHGQNIVYSRSTDRQVQTYCRLDQLSPKLNSHQLFDKQVMEHNYY